VILLPVLALLDAGIKAMLSPTLSRFLPELFLPEYPASS
jgi:hypothetical protein